jgi:hypothetical protein
LAEIEPSGVDFRQMRDELRGGSSLPNGELSNLLEQLIVRKRVDKKMRRHISLVTSSIREGLASPSSNAPW